MAPPSNWEMLRVVGYLVNDDNTAAARTIRVQSSQTRLQDKTSRRVIFPSAQSKAPAVTDGYFYFDLISDTDTDITPTGRQHKVTLLSGSTVLQTWFVNVDHLSSKATTLRFDALGNIVSSGGTQMPAIWLTDLEDFSDAPVVGGGGGSVDLSNYFTKAQTTAQVSSAITALKGEADPFTQYATNDELTSGLGSKADSSALSGKADTSALTAHTARTDNPHATTKAQVGLGNVDNTSDASKPISAATQSALDGLPFRANNTTTTGAAVGGLSALRKGNDGAFALEQALGGKAQTVGKEFRLVLAGDQSGGIGGNGTVNGDSDSTPKLTIQSWQSPHGPNVGGFGQGIRLDVMHPLAKNLLVWRMPKDPTTAWSETNYLQDVLWMGAHYRHTNPDNTPGDIGAHFHWSIEIPDANGALQTRWQIKIGDVATGKIGLDRTNIVTSNADTTIAAENGLFRLAGETVAKIIEFAKTQPGTDKYFQLKVDGAANNDLILTRYLSDSNSFTAMRVQRATGRVAFGQAAVEAGAAFTLAWSEATDRGFVAKPSVATTTNAAFTALLAATTDRAIDIRDAAGSTPRFEVSGTGILAWGPGSAGRDTNLYRADADLLATDDAFRLANRGTAPATPSAAAVIYASGGVLTAKNASGDVISLARQTAVADVTGGTTVDAETRATLNALLARLRTIGLIAA